METKFIDQVIIKQGDRYVIAVTKDHNSGIVIQVARLNPTHVRNDNAVSFKGHEPVVLWQQVIPLGTKKPNGDIDFRDALSIDADLKVNLGRAQQYTQKCIQTETAVDLMLSALAKEVTK